MTDLGTRLPTNCRPEERALSSTRKGTGDGKGIISHRAVAKEHEWRSEVAEVVRGL